jgi:hypothetical protein
MLVSRLALTAVAACCTFTTSAISRGADAVPVQAGTANLTPQNTKIQFVCAHVGARPDPRKGGFAKFSGKAQAGILVYLSGGPSHMDTFDLKPDAPAEYRGEFKPIQTNVPGMEICELMPLQAKIADIGIGRGAGDQRRVIDVLAGGGPVGDHRAWGKSRARRLTLGLGGPSRHTGEREDLSHDVRLPNNTASVSGRYPGAGAGRARSAACRVCSA